MANYHAPDGYRYGVQFSDGSVAEYWNGSTQRQRAKEYLDSLLEEYPGDHFRLVRRGGPWEPIPDA